MNLVMYVGPVIMFIGGLEPSRNGSVIKPNVLLISEFLQSQVYNTWMKITPGYGKQSMCVTMRKCATDTLRICKKNTTHKVYILQRHLRKNACL